MCGFSSFASFQRSPLVRPNGRIHTCIYMCCLPFGNGGMDGMTLALRSHGANHMLAIGMSIWHSSPPLSKKQVKNGHGEKRDFSVRALGTFMVN
jgi:hypothetical protein